MTEVIQLVDEFQLITSKSLSIPRTFGIMR